LPPREELSRILRRGQRERRLPSASAAVFEDGEVTWSEAVGLADAASGAPATPETQYRIGSITKVFTTLAVLRLRDHGVLDLDDPLERHLPGTPLGELRLRGMLSHTSGLQRERPGIDWEKPRPLSPEELLGGLPEAERVLAPGQGWHYSNLAFDLLGEVVGRVAGTPYRDYVDTHIIGPLGLTRTTWEPEPPVAKGYFVEPYSDAVREQPPDDIGLGASGQLWSTAADVARLGTFLCDPDPNVLRPATAADMHVVHGMTDTTTWTAGYGLGLQLFRRGERVFAGHTGGMPGFVSILCYARLDRVGAVVLTSSGAPTGEPTGLLLAEKALEHREASAWRPSDPPSELEELVGRWWSEGYEFVFFVRDGKLQARLAEGPPAAEPAVFEPDGDGRFRAAWGRERGEPLVVERDATGAVKRMLWATYPFTREPSAF
jgi:CubicO group peptidase (beta-lactamase class C family)